MRSCFAGLALWLSLAGSVAAEELTLAQDHPDSYVVRRGDTLWDIAGRFLARPWQWPELWRGNPQIRDPDLIYPGDVLALKYIDGVPRLVLESGGDTVSGDQRLSPSIRYSPVEQAIPTIPMSAIRQFLTRPRVVEVGELQAAPYIVNFAGEHIMGGAGDRIYVRAIERDTGDAYIVFRPGLAFHDPDSAEVLGYEALYVADTQLQRTGDPATLLVERSEREVLIGDRLLAVQRESVPLTFQPHAPAKSLKGHILHVVDGVTQIGQYQVVVIDRGQADGVETGHVFEVWQRGLVERDVVNGNPSETVRLPDEKAGELMVFKPFQRVSYALIMKARQALHLLDVVQAPR